MSIGYNVKTLNIINDGNTLYVGGNGSGNYSKIQDAIDIASNGDTVFVYDESSPYYEHLIINKQIKLIGEDRNTTVIIGKNYDAILIRYEVENVQVSGFTITSDLDFPLSTITSDLDFPLSTITSDLDFPLVSSGIFLAGNKSIISDNFITKYGDGITIIGIENLIQGNILVGNSMGIRTDSNANNNNITKNIIAHNLIVGIKDDAWHERTFVTWNLIGDNARYIHWQDSGGLYIHNTKGSVYHHNDFLLNDVRNAYSSFGKDTIWDDGTEGNYWDDWESNPGYPDEYIIKGYPNDSKDYHPSATPYINYPIVKINYSYYALIDEPLIFNPKINKDPSSVTWFWEFGDGTTSNEESPSHAYSKSGLYIANLTVVDSQGKIDSTFAEVHIGRPPDLPTISVKYIIGDLYLNTICTTDPDGDDVYYFISWRCYIYYDSKDIGPYASGKSANVFYRKPDSEPFIVSFVAYDIAGLESPWGELEVNMPRDKAIHNTLIYRIFKQFPILQILLQRLRI